MAASLPARVEPGAANRASQRKCDGGADAEMASLYSVGLDRYQDAYGLMGESR